MAIIKGREYGDPRNQLAEIDRDEMKSRLAERQASSKPGSPRVISNNMFQTPDGGFHKRGQFAAGQGTLAGGGQTFTGGSYMTGGGGTRGQTITSAPIFYDPRYSTPDKFYFPRTEVQANAMWRHLYETDAAISVATDMFAEMPWSEFDLIGMEDKDIKNTFEDMFSSLNLAAHLEDLSREYVKLGKVIPHLIFDNKKGYFTRLGAWDPDYIRLIPVPFMGEEPLLDLKPDPSMRAFMKSTDARAQLIKSKIPAFIRDRINTNTPIPLQNTNTTYLARKTSPYRTIGTSIYTRLFRIQMFEDFIVNASMAVAQRNAAPLRLFKLGDPNTGWLPDDSDISQFAELLAIVESVEGDHYVNILTDNGLQVLTFDELWENTNVPVNCFEVGKEQKDISHLGWRTLSLNDDGSQDWELITTIRRHKTPDEVVCLKTPQAEIRSTESHGFLWLNPETAEFETVTPKQLEERDRPTVVTVRNFDYKVSSDVVFDQKIIPDFSYFMGLWTTDGSLNPTSNYLLLTSKDSGILDWLLSFGNRYEGIEEIKIWNGKKGTQCKNVGLRSSIIRQQLMKFYDFSSGRGNSVKKTGMEKLPNELLFNNKDEIKGALWAGVLDGDGSVSSREITIYNTSLRLLHQLSLSFLTCGIHSRISPLGNSTKTYETSFNGTLPVYRLVISGKENLEKFISLSFPFLQHTKKRERTKKLLDVYAQKPTRQFFTDVYDFDPVLLKEAFPMGYINAGYDNMHDGKSRHDIVGKNPKRRLSIDVIKQHAQPSKIATQSERFCSVAVQKISRIEKRCDYVYDLAINAKSHNYLVGGLGWCLNHNTDPFGALIYHNGVEIDYVGVSDRLMSISREWDFIERVKLLALGLSKAFLVGETSFAAALAGLQTLMERLLALRRKFTNNWIMPKIVKPVARMNGFYRRTKAELDHRIRYTKSDSDLIYPQLKWHKSLEATQDTSILQIWDELNRRGIVSERTLAAGAGINLDIERRNIREELEYKKEEDWPKSPEEREETLHNLMEASVNNKASTEEFKFHVPSEFLDSRIWNKQGYCLNIHYTEVEPIVEYIRTGQTNDSEWENVFKMGKLSWATIDEELQAQGRTDPEIKIIQKILEEERVLSSVNSDLILESEEKEKEELNRRLVNVENELNENESSQSSKNLISGAL